MASGERPLPEGTDSIIDSDGFEAVDRDDAVVESTELDDLDELDDIDDLDGDEPQAAASSAASAASPGASAGSSSASASTPGSTTSADASADSAAFFGKFDDLRGQATDRAFAFAQAGKDRATGAIDDVVRMVEGAADEIDAKVGSQYGDYARHAAESLGGFSDAFKDKQVDELFADARDLVRKSPAVAIGAAAALGFVVARLVKASVPDGTPPAKSPGA